MEETKTVVLTDELYKKLSSNNNKFHYVNGYLDGVATASFAICGAALTTAAVIGCYKACEALADAYKKRKNDKIGKDIADAVEVEEEKADGCESV